MFDIYIYIYFNNTLFYCVYLVYTTSDNAAVDSVFILLQFEFIYVVGSVDWSNFLCLA